MSGLSKALSRSRAMIGSAEARATRLKQSGGLADALTPATSGGFGQSREQTRSRMRYAQNRGWLYAAVHALSQEGAGQPVHVGKLAGASPRGDEDERSRRMRRKHAEWIAGRSASPRIKSAATELEILEDHPLLDTLERPNPAQNRWQFTYSFIANLNITGWAFIVGEEFEGQLRLYSLPTTWVRPVHKNGLYAQFRVVDPADPRAASSDESDLIDRSQVGFAHFPDPSDPRKALAPSAAQELAIRIDDKIQTSQDAFFDNGHFPSVVITVGKNPLGDNPNGNRPRLEGHQRRQVFAAIQSTQAGVENYGYPAIIDGLIERIDRLSATSNEMGWDKSEDKTKTRILSAFGVHPYILGEPVSVGGYAQAAKIEERFCKRVNTNLDLLGTTVNHFTSQVDDVAGRLLAWWTECAPHDPALASRNMIAGRNNGDVTQNEFRAFLGLPPDEDRNEREIDSRTAAAVRNVLMDLGKGIIRPQQAEAFFRGMGMSDDLAADLSNGGRETLTEATEALDRAVATLRVGPEEIAGRLVDASK